jgi:hypothetical protein
MKLFFFNVPGELKSRYLEAESIDEAYKQMDYLAYLGKIPDRLPCWEFEQDI